MAKKKVTAIIKLQSRYNAVWIDCSVRVPKLLTATEINLHRFDFDTLLGHKNSYTSGTRCSFAIIELQITSPPWLQRQIRSANFAQT